MWVVKLHTYLETWLSCPDYGEPVHRTSNGWCQNAYGQLPGWRGVHTGYSVACYTTGAYPGKHIGQVKFPSGTISHLETTGACTQHSRPTCGCDNPGPVMAPRHNLGADFLFSDGHVEWSRWMLPAWQDPKIARWLLLDQG